MFQTPEVLVYPSSVGEDETSLGTGPLYEGTNNHWAPRLLKRSDGMMRLLKKSENTDMEEMMKTQKMMKNMFLMGLVKPNHWDENIRLKMPKK